MLAFSEPDETARHERALLDVVAQAGAVSHYRRTGQLTTEHLDELDAVLDALTAARRALLRAAPTTDDRPRPAPTVLQSAPTSLTGTGPT